MKFKRKYLAWLLLLLLLPIRAIVYKNADASTNLQKAKYMIAEWKKIRDKFPEISVKRVDHPDVGSMLEVSGTVKSSTELTELRNWFGSEFYQDEEEFADMVVPSSVNLVRYDVKISETQTAQPAG